MKKKPLGFILLVLVLALVLSYVLDYSHAAGDAQISAREQRITAASTCRFAVKTFTVNNGEYAGSFLSTLDFCSVRVLTVGKEQARSPQGFTHYLS